MPGTPRPAPPSSAEDDPYGILAACAVPGGSGGAPDFASQLLETLAHGALYPNALERTAVGGGARPGDFCAECHCALIVRELQYECPSCHALQEAADYSDVQPVSVATEAGEGALRGRLRVVGADSAWFQPDLDRTNPGEYSETQKKTTYAELRRLNEEYRGRGGNPFPLNVLSDVAENYNVIQQTSVKRSMMKRSILSALLFHACISRGFTRTKTEVAEFAKLRNHGIARGDDYIRMVNEDTGLAGLDMNLPRLEPHVATTFSELELEGDAYASLRAAVSETVRRANERLVGIRSVLRSKVISTTCEVLIRGRDHLLRLEPERSPPGVAEVVSRCGIRKHTISRFRQELRDYHSVFADIYLAHGLSADPIEEIEASPSPPLIVPEKARRAPRTAARRPPPSDERGGAPSHPPLPF